MGMMDVQQKRNTAERLRRLAKSLSPDDAARLTAMAVALDAEADALEQHPNHAPQTIQEQQQVQQQAATKPPQKD